MNKNNSNSVRIIMLGLVLGGLISLLSDIILSYKFGAGAFTDAFFIAQSVPFVLYLAFIVAITAGVVVLYNGFKKDEHINNVTSNILTVVFLLAIFVIIVVSLTIKPFIYLFAVGFDEETLSIAVNLTKIILYSLIPISIIGVIKGFLQHKKKFASVAFESIPIYICLFIGILLTSTEKYNILGISVVVGYCITAIIMLLSACRNGMRYKPVLKLKDENIKPLLVLILPIFANLLGYQINNFVDRTLASTIETGAISSLFYSQKLLMILISILFFIISSVVFPMLVKSYNKKQMRDFKEIALYSFNGIVAMILPLSIFLITLANPIITVIFQRGSFDVENTKLTADVFMMYSIGMLPLALKLMLDNIFYAMNDKKTPLIGTAIFVAANILLDYVLMKPLQTMGIALSTSIATTTTAIVMLLVLRNRIGKYSLKTVTANILKIIFAGIPISLGVLVAFTMIYYSMKNSLMNILLCLLIMGIVFKYCYKILFKILKVDGLNYNKLFKEELKATFFKNYKGKYKYEDLDYQPISIPIVGYENYFRMPYNYDLDKAEEMKDIENVYNEPVEISIDNDQEDISELPNEFVDHKHSMQHFYRNKKSLLPQYKLARYRLMKYTLKNKFISNKCNKTNHNLDTKISKENNMIQQIITKIFNGLLKVLRDAKNVINKTHKKIYTAKTKKKVEKFLSMPIDDKFDNED